MKKNMKKIKIAAVAVLFIFIGTSAAQAVVFTNVKNTAKVLADEKPFLLSSYSAKPPWSDDFLDSTKVDGDRSSNIEVKDGKASIKNTYAAWHYPWPKMKEITITNTGGAKEQYVLFLENVAHEPEMQPDYSDIRFVDGNANDLDYWIGADYDQYYADIWVRLSQTIPANGQATIYMFYGDKNAPSHSNFDMIFKWDDKTDPDIMISYKNYLEGAWDPDVAYGNGRFLVAWEERLGPEDLPNDMERTIFCVIHGRSYNSNGGDPKPSGDADIDISDPGDTACHKENPSIAYGNGKFFVVWEYNPTAILHRYEIDIGGAIVTISSSGTATVNSRFHICEANLIQADPIVAYGNGVFFVVWEDSRAGTNNYDVWGRIYYSNGNPKTNEFQITSDPNYQGEPWVCADDQGGFMIVYEGGSNPETGPFSLYAQKFDANGNRIMSEKLLASGSSALDNIFPSVCYNPIPVNHGRYFIAWNDGDVSSSDWRGNIWGKTLNTDGSTEYNNFYVQQGDHYVRTDVAPFLGDMFLVCFDGQTDVWGKLFYSDTIYTNAKALSDGSSLNLDWNNLAVSDQGTVMVVWEDERDQASEYADTFGSVWHIYKSGASSDISYSFSAPKDMTNNAVLMSIVIPSTDVEEWKTFTAQYERGLGSITFDVMNEQGTSVLHSGLGDISNLNLVPIRLRATFSRNLPDTAMYVDKWTVDYIGIDFDPPETHLTKNPASPNGDNGWYKSSVEITLLGLDGEGSGIKTINYKIDDEPVQTSFNNPCIFTIWASGTHTIEYWSIDNANNVEEHKFEHNLKIDSSKPTVSIVKPEEFEVPAGPIAVEAKVTESESGIARVQFYVNGEKKDETTDQSETYYFSFDGAPGMFYSIVVKAYDLAGSYGEDSKDVQTTPEERNWEYSPKIGYWYTSTDSGESILLLVLSCSLMITSNMNIKVKPPSSYVGVDHVTFKIVGRVTAEGTERADSDGYFKYNFDPPTGFYSITATCYDSSDHKIQESFGWGGGKVLFINTV